MKQETKGAKIFQIILSIAIIIFSFIIVVFAKSIKGMEGTNNFGLDWEQLQRWDFWVLTIVISITMLSGYYGSYWIRRSSLITSESFYEYVNKYNDRLKLKANNFDDYVRYDNLKEKKKTYINNKNKKLGHYKNLYNKIPNEKLNNHRSIQIKSKIEKLEYELSPEYIDKNILCLKVHYKKISSSAFKENTFGAIIDDRKVVSYESAKLSTKALQKVLTGTLTSALITATVSFAYFVFDFSFEFWIIMGSTFFSCIINIFFGYTYALKIFLTDIQGPIINKIKFLEDYVIWNKTHPSDTPMFKEIMSEYFDDKLKKIKEEKA